MTAAAVVVAAGRGTRLGSTTPKAFVPIAGRPMAVYALRTLTALPEIGTAVLVVAGDFLDAARALLERWGPWRMPVTLTPGGAERQDSVAAGAALVPDDCDLVAVHDAARPFVSADCVRACLSAAAAAGAALAALPAHDTVKEVSAGATVARTLDRSRIWMAQTPQVFRPALLRRALEQARRDGYRATDDAELVERLGVAVRVVPGEADNRKLTTPADLRWAEWYVQSGGWKEPVEGE